MKSSTYQSLGVVHDGLLDEAILEALVAHLLVLVDFLLGVLLFLDHHRVSQVVIFEIDKRIGQTSEEVHYFVKSINK